MTTYAITRAAGTGWRELRTGMLFLIGLVLVASLAMIIGKNTTMLTSYGTAHIILPDIKGLVEGNLVSIAGKKVGTVSRLDFTRINGATGVVVDLDIRSEYFDLVTSNSTATIKSLGMLGDKYIDITVGDAVTPLREGAYLDVRSDAGFEELTSSAITTVSSLGDVSKTIGSLLTKIDRGDGTLGQLVTSDDLSNRLNGTLDNLQSVTGAIASGKGPIGRLLTDRRMGDDIAASLSQMKGVMDTLALMSGSLQAGNGTLGRLLTDETLYERLAAVTLHADSLLGDLQGRSSAVLDGFSNSSQLYGSLTRSISSLDSLLTDVKKNPGRYVSIRVF